MSKPQPCSRPEWLHRAGEALSAFRPDLDPDELAQIVNGQLGDEACQMSPEDAVRIYVVEHPE